MGTVHADINPALATWIAAQRMFFVGTAPLAADGHINVSPKGGRLRVLDPQRVAYDDVTGSGAEGIAHLRENGRILIMLCAFDGPPRIVRLHGRGRIVLPTDPDWLTLADPAHQRPGTRAIIAVAVTRVSSSCGMGVPRYAVIADRDDLDVWASGKGETGLMQYRHSKNQRSIDDLPAYPSEPA